MLFNRITQSESSFFKLSNTFLSIPLSFILQKPQDLFLLLFHQLRTPSRLSYIYTTSDHIPLLYHFNHFCQHCHFPSTSCLFLHPTYLALISNQSNILGAQILLEKPHHHASRCPGAHSQLGCSPLWPTIYVFLVSILCHHSRRQVTTIRKPSTCPLPSLLPLHPTSSM